MKTTNDGQPKHEWPSVPLAYEFVIPSYEWMQSRLDPINSRIQTMLTFAAGLGVASLLLVTAIEEDPDFKSIWFLLAVISLAAMIIGGSIGRIWGGVTLVSPKVLYDNWLHYSEEEFKRYAIYRAGQHFEANRSVVNRKGWFEIGLAMLLLLELLFLSLWIAVAL